MDFLKKLDSVVIYLSEEEMQQERTALTKLMSKTDTMVSNGRKTVKSLRVAADKVDEFWKTDKKVHLVGTTAGLAGGIVTIIGGVLTFTTAGAASPLLFTGITLTLGGTGANVVSSIRQALKSSAEIESAEKDLKKTLESVNEVMEIVQDWTSNKSRSSLVYICRVAQQTLKWSNPVMKILCGILYYSVEAGQTAALAGVQAVVMGTKEVAMKACAGVVAKVTTQTAGKTTTQAAAKVTTQTAGKATTQAAAKVTSQTAGKTTTQVAAKVTTQTAGKATTQAAAKVTTQTAGKATTQAAAKVTTQTAGKASAQAAAKATTQAGGKASVEAAAKATTQAAGKVSVEAAGKAGTQAAGEATAQGALKTLAQSSDDLAQAGAKAGIQIGGKIIIGISTVFFIWDAIDLTFTIWDLVEDKGSDAARVLREKANMLENALQEAENKNKQQNGTDMN